MMRTAHLDGCIAILLLVAVALSEVEALCQDNIDNCRDYNKANCQTYKQWAERDCPKTCGFCPKPTTRTPVTSSCPPGWKQYYGDRTCLKFTGFANTNDKKTWFKARGQCKYYGGDLVIIRDEYKNAFVKAMCPKNTVIWIGLRNVGANPNSFTFKYVDGSFPGDYHPWTVGNPDNFNNQERCVTMSRELWDGYWNDLDCGVSRAYVCQKGAVQPGR